MKDRVNLYFTISRILATLLAAGAVVVIAVFGKELVPPWAAPTILNRLLLGGGLILIPMMLVWFPVTLGKGPPPWVSEPTLPIAAHLAGWGLLVIIFAGACLLLW